MVGGGVGGRWLLGSDGSGRRSRKLVSLPWLNSDLCEDPGCFSGETVWLRLI